jgi:tetratricopeptide (TPR) repeat protein
MQMAALVLVVLTLALGGCAKTPQQRASAKKAKAASYLKEGKPREAALELRGALEDAPNDKEALFELGEAFTSMRQFQEAYGAFKRVTELDPKNLSAQLRLADLYLLANSPDEARKRAEEVLRQDPNQANAHATLAAILLRKGRIEEALGHFDRAIALEPGNLDRRLVKAAALWEAKRLGDAAGVLNEILAKEPSHMGALVLSAQVLDAQGNRVGAEAAFSRVIQSRPSDPKMLLAYGNYLEGKGDTKKALDVYRKAGSIDSKGMDGWQKAAELALSAGDFGVAKEAVKEIFARSPKSTQGRYYEARIALGEGKSDAAIAGFQEVIKQYPNDSSAHYYLGLTYSRLRNYPLAKAEVQKAVELRGTVLKYKLLLAQTYEDAGDHELALKVTDDLLKGGRGHPEAVMIRASALLGLGRPGEARALLEQVVKVFPRDARAQERLGLAYLREGKPRQALEPFGKALEINPKNPGPLASSVSVLLADKRPDQAMTRVNAWVQKVGDSATARELAGQVLRFKGDKAGAREQFQRAIALDAGASEAYMALAKLEPWPQGVRRAIADLDKALEKRPNYLQAHMLKGTLFSVMGQSAEAQKAYRKALEIKPDFPAALNELAWSLAENGGNLDEALKFAEKSVELSPKVDVFNDTLGWIYVKKGVYLKAATHLEMAATSLSGNPVVLYHLGKAYEGIGDVSRATGSLTRALKISSKFPGAEDAKKTLEKLRLGGKAKG